MLRGIGGESLAEEVAQLAAGLGRIAGLSAAVCGPYYSALIQELLGAARGGSSSSVSAA